MKIKHKYLAVVVLLGMITFLSFADSLEEYENKIQKSTRRLKELDRQIAVLQSEVKKYQQQERNLIAELDNTERQISLTSDKIRVQQRELELRKEKQTRLKSDHKRAQANGEELLERYEQRVKRAYKLRPARQWDLFIDAASPREFYYRVKYITAVNRADRDLYNDIRDNISFIAKRQKQIEAEASAIRKNVRDLEKEQISLKKLLQEKEKQYDRIHSDKKLLAEQIEEKERSKKEIQNIIESTQKDKKAYLTRLEEERKKREITERPFSDKKGKLPWPARGKVIGKYGDHRHPVLGTITENSGIDIETENAGPVRAVSDGMVVTVTWLRGFGNTIIVMHDNSYYSVYSHVEDVRVIQDEYVDSGQQIAVVSNGGSIGRPVLHFELWEEQKKLNPEYWLRK